MQAACCADCERAEKVSRQRYCGALEPGLFLQLQFRAIVHGDGENLCGQRALEEGIIFLAMRQAVVAGEQTP